MLCMEYNTIHVNTCRTPPQGRAETIQKLNRREVVRLKNRMAQREAPRDQDITLHNSFLD